MNRLVAAVTLGPMVHKKVYGKRRLSELDDVVDEGGIGDCCCVGKGKEVRFERKEMKKLIDWR
jgi:hypothetical protein